MSQKMTWEEIVQNYPNEWVALTHYEQRNPSAVDGIVIAHEADRKKFHEHVGQLLPKCDGGVALRYTGEIVVNPDIPLLWQIFRTAQ